MCPLNLHKHTHTHARTCTRMHTNTQTRTDQLVKAVTTAMNGDSVTDRVAEQALDVVDVVVADVQQAIRAGHVKAIVTSTVDAFRGVASHLSKDKMRVKESEAQTTIKPNRTLVKKLRSLSDAFCNVLTASSAPGTEQRL